VSVDPIESVSCVESRRIDGGILFQRKKRQGIDRDFCFDICKALSGLLGEDIDLQVLKFCE
jgi:hypothetical protein